MMLVLLPRKATIAGLFGSNAVGNPSGPSYSPAVFAGRRSVVCALGATLVAALVHGNCNVARAGEDEWQFDLAVGGAANTTDESARWGPSLGAAAQWGLTDAWAVRAAWDHRLRPGSSAALLAAGITYTVDVLRWLPFAELGVATLLEPQGGQWHMSAGPQVAVGADYLLDRRYSVGAVAKYSYLPIVATGPTPHVAIFAVRLSYRLF